MGLKKGQTNNRKGRPLGSENKMTKPIRESITSLVEDNIDTFQKDLNSLEPRMKIKVIVDLLGFILPKYAPIPYNYESDNKPKSFHSWFEEAEKRLSHISSDE